MPTYSERRFVDMSNTEFDWNSQNGPRPDPWTTSYRLPVDRTRTDGGSVPGWKYKTKHQIDATSSFEASELRYDVQRGEDRYTVEYRDPYNNLTHTIEHRLSGVTVSVPTPPYPGYASMTSAENKAIIEFVRRAHSAQTKLQGLIVVGELGKTIRMIRSPAKALFTEIGRHGNRVRAALKRNRRIKDYTGRKARHIAADLWLEAAYGWGPLISDVEHGAKALAQLNLGLLEFKYIKGEGRSLEIVEDTVYESGTGFAFKSEVTQSNIEVQVVYRGVIGCSINGAPSPSLKMFGVDWRELVLTGWELIPYSFLVDYFTNIGEILEAHSLAVSNFHWKNVTIRRIGTAVKSSRYKPKVLSEYQSYSDFGVSPCSISAQSKIVSRAPHMGPLIPTLEFSVPWTGKRWLNMAALAMNRFERRR